MKNKIIISIVSLITIATTVIIIIICNTPKIKYEYNNELDGYFVVEAIFNDEEYEILEQYNNKDVIGIDQRAFFRHNKLKRITLPKTIKYINKLAFSECSNLESINLENVIQIQRNAFSYDYKLNNIILNAKDIGSSAFFSCTNLDNITLNNTKTIGSYAFSKTKIDYLYLPDTLEEIYNDAFSDMEFINKISLPYKEDYHTYVYSLDFIEFRS